MGATGVSRNPEPFTNPEKKSGGGKAAGLSGLEMGNRWEGTRR